MAEPLLDTYTNEDIAQREAEQRERIEAEQRAEREAEQREQADRERDDFTLTGSDRDADVAASRGQGGLFAEQTPRGYAARRQDTQTTDLFGDPYESLETRPETTEVQRQTGRDALEAARRILGPVGVRGDRASVLGSQISRDFRADGGTTLVGKRVESAADLAAIAQVLRDPRFETFRVFYTNDDGKIVGEAAYSSRDWRSRESPAAA